MADIHLKAKKRTEKEAFFQYAHTFIQRTPKHGVRDPNWRTVDAPVTNDDIQAHLDGKKILGTLSRWYPSYAILDVDDAKYPNLLYEIRKELGIAADASAMTCETSPGSYHILFRPQYDGRPATVKMLHDLLGHQVKELSARLVARRDVGEVALYPQSSRVIRAPFHPSCPFVSHSPLPTLGEKMGAFGDLSVVELKKFALERARARREAGKAELGEFPPPRKGVMREGMELFQGGMEASSPSRYYSQHKVALYLWRENLTPEQALEELWRWVCEKTNGHSKDAVAILKGDGRTVSQVRKEQEHIVAHIWGSFERRMIYPASTHNGFYGWLSEQDYVIAAKHCGGNLPRFKFLVNLFAYVNIHKKLRLPVHRSKLQDFCGRAGTKGHHKNDYLRHVERFEEMGILRREDHYLAGEFSKMLSLSVKPSFVDFTSGKTLTDGMEQSLTFEEGLEEMGRKKIYAMLTENGVPYRSAYQFVERRLLID